MLSLTPTEHPMMRTDGDGYVKVICDSLSRTGVRLTTFEVRMRRFMLPEFNTHRTFSRNSASSRAIPLSKQLRRIYDQLAYPTVFPAEQKGMQGGAELDVGDRMAARDTWREASEDAARHAAALGDLGVHKSVANRLLEPFMWHTVVVTATAWENFFTQRDSALAQPEIHIVAEAMRRLYRDLSQPVPLEEGSWHAPYISQDEWGGPMSTLEIVQISAARCARVSYLTQDGVRDTAQDLLLYDRLTSADPPHWSPLEHVATPWPANRQNDYRRGLTFDALEGGTNYHVETSHLPRVGNLLQWRSLRTEVETIKGVRTYA